MRTIRIAVSVPNEGLTRPQAYDNHLRWAIHLGVLQERSKQENWEEQYEFYWYTAGRLMTAYAREQMAKAAVADGMDYVCMLDDDMIIYDIDIMERLLAHKVDVVAPLAFMRNHPHHPVMFRAVKGYDAVAKADYHINTTVLNYEKNMLNECDGVGFGMVLIDCKVLKGMQEPYFMSTTGAGEDVYFCIKAREKGFRVFMDTSLKLGHIGEPPIITEETFEKTMDTDEYRKLYGIYKHSNYFGSDKTRLVTEGK